MPSRKKVNNKPLSSLLAKNLPIFILGFLLLVVVPITISLFNTQSQLKQHAAGSNDIYVSPNGNDTNDGSQATPFITIQKAADVAIPGTTVHVLSGTYNPITINTSGTAAAPITFVSDTKWGAKIVGTGNGSTKSYLVRNNASYIHFLNFDMSGKGITDGLDNFGAYNLIQGNHIHDMTNITCSGSPGGAGLGDDAGTNNTYDGNVVNNIGDYPTKCDYVHAIYVDDTGDIVTNNIAYNNVGNGLYTNHGTGSVLFANNLSYANKEYGVGVNGSASGNIVENNILIGNGIAGIKTWSGTSNTQIANNILFNNATNFILSGSAIQTGNLTVDPQLVNYVADGTGDYHLKATSPAIDAGISTNAPSIDFDGNARPQGNGFDIGVYEYLTGITITPTPVATATPTLTPSPIPTNTPTPIVNAFIAKDTFARANQTYWGTASDGQKWAGDANTSNKFSITSNAGKISSGSTSGINYNAVLGPSLGNAQILFSGSMSSFSSSNIGGVLRWQDANNWYKAYIDGSNLYIQKSVNGTKTTVKSASFSASTNTSYTIRFQVSGTTLSARAWKTGTTEPTTWKLTATDTSFASGYVGLRTLLKSNVTASYTAFQATSL
ncbi:MAG TPA: right-handed parallel beta-helix repeat-containing protein [Candidatus Saccharimonadales bacterium]|nr:right-handed parallel beta-helix repeat-containing protein [Candidatus Saccharimonadales bacterium]